MTPRPAKETRENFEAGKADAWSTGAHGQTVRVFLHRGKLKLRYTHPRTGRPKQETLFTADSLALRKKAAAAAVAFAEKLRTGAAAGEEAAAIRAEDLTIWQACMLYMRRVPGFEERLLAKATAGEIARWYATLPEAVRDLQTTPKDKSIWSDVYGFRRLFRDARFAPSRRVVDLEPADATTYAADYIAAGGSPRTAANDTDRLSCAIRYVMHQHRRSVGLLYNPLEGRKVDRSRARIERFHPHEARKIWRAARKNARRGRWHLLVAGLIATSGRRLGAIRALTLADHDIAAGTVTWRAKAAKAEQYGRGDEVRPMTRWHRVAIRYARRFHPNPLGPHAPLLWLKNDPSRPVYQGTLWKQLLRAQRQAEVPTLPGRSWHSFRRMMATALADEMGDGKAAEYVGMTPETLRKFGYKQVQHDVQEETARAADQILEAGA